LREATSLAYLALVQLGPGSFKPLRLLSGPCPMKRLAQKRFALPRLDTRLCSKSGSRIQTRLNPLLKLVASKFVVG
jgi:hypothetical protein